MVTNWHESYLNEDHPLQYYCCNKNITVINIEPWRTLSVIFLPQSCHEEQWILLVKIRVKSLYDVILIPWYLFLSLSDTTKTCSSSAIVCWVTLLKHAIWRLSSFNSSYNRSFIAGQSHCLTCQVCLHVCAWSFQESSESSYKDLTATTVRCSALALCIIWIWF